MVPVAVLAGVTNELGMQGGGDAHPFACTDAPVEIDGDRVLDDRRTVATPHRRVQTLPTVTLPTDR